MTLAGVKCMGWVLWLLRPIEEVLAGQLLSDEGFIGSPWLRQLALPSSPHPPKFLACLSCQLCISSMFLYSSYSDLVLQTRTIYQPCLFPTRTLGCCCLVACTPRQCCADSACTM
jgi:hypothetical protein